MALPEFLQNNLRVPVVGSPLFLVSGPELVIAQCKAGIIGSFPALNARPAEVLDEWLTRINTELEEYKAANPDAIVAPYAVNQICHASNDRLMVDMETCVKHKVPIIITSLRPPAEVVEAAHSYGGVVYHDVINVKHARKAAEEGVDGLILVCAGAGGHAGALSPFALLREVKEWFDGTILLSGAIGDGFCVASALAMGADLAYLGTRFINTAECQSPEGYKQMIIDSAFGDVVATPAVSGVNANFLTASLANAGFDLDVPHDHGLVDIDKELAEALTDESNSFKAWRDIWSAGHGVGSIDDIPTVADLVARLHAEYHAACVAQQGNRDKLVPMDRPA